MNVKLTPFGMLFLFAVVVGSMDLCFAAEISGTVTDDLHGTPVASALVQIKGTGITANTNASGAFTLTTTAIRQPGTVPAAWDAPDHGDLTVYGFDGKYLAAGPGPNVSTLLSSLPDGIYLYTIRTEGPAYTGKLVKAGAQCQTGQLRPVAAGKAASSVTLVFSHNHYRTREQVAAEGDDKVQVGLVLKKGWELDETTTGLAGAGIDKNSLPLYTGSDTPPYGTVIREKKITDCLVLVNGNITIERCWIQPKGTRGQGSLIFTYDPSFSRPSQYQNSIIDCDIDGSVITDTRVYADAAIRGGGLDALRCNIFGMGSGIAVFSSGYGLNCRIEQNYVHDLRAGMYGDPPQGSHNESATIRGFDGTSLIWRNNRLESLSGSDSGALFIQAWQAHINCATITGNLFKTYGWCIPLEANRYGYEKMAAVNNRFVLGGYGPAYVTGGPGWAQWTDNYYNNPNFPPENKGPAISRP